MADFGRQLPKWQTLANLIPNYVVANTMPQKYFISRIFFICYSRLLLYNVDIKSKKERGKKMLSDCCGKPVYYQDICSRCGEHCEVSSDDGYDAARDAYLTGHGPAFTSRQIQEEKDWADECRYNGW